MIKLRPFRQTLGFCGPASLKMVLAYYKVNASEAEIAKLAQASRAKGTSIGGLARAAKHFGFKVFLKKNGTLNDLRRFVKRGIPVLVDWFLEDDGHYSIVVDINSKDIVLMDPALKGRRKMSLKKFFRVWFDFPGDFIKNQGDLILRLMLVLTKN